MLDYSPYLVSSREVTREDSKQCFSTYKKHLLNKKLTCYFIYLVLCLPDDRCSHNAE